MNKRVILNILIILLVVLITGCNNKENDIMNNQNTIEESISNNSEETTNTKEEDNTNQSIPLLATVDIEKFKEDKANNKLGCTSEVVTPNIESNELVQVLVSAINNLYTQLRLDNNPLASLGLTSSEVSTKDEKISENNEINNNLDILSDTIDYSEEFLTDDISTEYSFADSESDFESDGVINDLDEHPEFGIDFEDTKENNNTNVTDIDFGIDLEDTKENDEEFGIDIEDIKEITNTNVNDDEDIKENNIIDEDASKDIKILVNSLDIGGDVA